MLSFLKDLEEVSNSIDLNDNKNVQKSQSKLTKPRKMYKQTFEYNLIEQPDNLLQLKVEGISTIEYPQIICLSDSYRVIIKGNFYVILSSGIQRYISRNSHPNSRLIKVIARKNISETLLCCLQEFEERQNIKKVHLNIYIEYAVQTQQKLRNQSRDIYFWVKQRKHKKESYQQKIRNKRLSRDSKITKVQQIFSPQTQQYLQSFTFVDLFITTDIKTCLIVFKYDKKYLQRYLIVVIDSSKDSNQTQEQLFDEKCLMSQLIVQNFIKIIKCDTNDLIYIITQLEIIEYEIKKCDKKEIIKFLNVNKFLNLPISHEKTRLYINSNFNTFDNESLIDASFSLNTSKIIVLTSFARILFIKQRQLLNIFQIFSFPQFPYIQTQFTNLYVFKQYIGFTNHKQIFLIKQNYSYFATISLSSSEQYMISTEKQLNSISLSYIYPCLQGNLKHERIKINNMKRQMPEQMYFQFWQKQSRQMKDIGISFATNNIFILHQSSISVWKIKNFYPFLSNNFEKQFQKNLSEPCYKISVHPIGFNILIMFNQRIQVYLYEFNYLEPFIQKNCQCSIAKYSNDGNSIITVQLNHLHRINLYNCYTFQRTHSFTFYLIDHIYNIQDVLGNYFFHSFNPNNPSQKKFTILNQRYNKALTIQFTDKIVYDLDSKYAVFVDEHGVVSVHQIINIVNQNQIEQNDIAQMKPLKKYSFTFFENQYPTCVKIIQKLGFLLVGTNFGYIRQVIWPLTQTKQPKKQEYTIKVSNNSIIQIFLDDSFSKLYAVSSQGSIINVKIMQYIDSKITHCPYVYELGKPTILSRELRLKNYILYKNHFECETNSQISDLQIILKSMNNNVNTIIGKFEMIQQSQLQCLRQKIVKQSSDYNYQFENFVKVHEQTKLKMLKGQINSMRNNKQLDKKLIIDQNYQQLKKISSQTDKILQFKLATIQNSQNIIQEVKLQHSKNLSALNQQNQIQLSNYQNQFTKINHQYQNQHIINLQVMKDQQIQQQLLIQYYQRKMNAQFQAQETKGEHLMAQNVNLERKIKILNLKSIFFYPSILNSNDQFLLKKQLAIKSENISKILKQQIQFNKRLYSLQKQSKLQYNQQYQIKNAKNFHQSYLKSYQKTVKEFQDYYISLNQQIINQQNKIRKQMMNFQLLRDKVAQKSKLLARFKKILNNQKIRTELSRTKYKNTIKLINSLVQAHANDVIKHNFQFLMRDFSEGTNETQEFSKILIKIKTIKKNTQLILNNKNRQFTLNKYYKENSELSQQYGRLMQQNQKYKNQIQKLKQNILKIQESQSLDLHYKRPQAKSMKQKLFTKQKSEQKCYLSLKKMRSTTALNQKIANLKNNIEALESITYDKTIKEKNPQLRVLFSKTPIKRQIIVFPMKKKERIYLRL